MSEFQNRGDTPRVQPPADNTPKKPDPDVQQKMEAVRSSNEAKEPKPAKDQEPASGQRERKEVPKADPPPSEDKPKPNQTNPESPGRYIGLV